MYDINRIKYFLNQAGYLSSKAVGSIIGEKSQNFPTAIRIMKKMAKDEPEKYIFLPYMKYKIPCRIYRREALWEDEKMLNLFVSHLKNRCYGGRI